MPKAVSEVTGGLQRSASTRQKKKPDFFSVSDSNPSNSAMSKVKKMNSEEGDGCPSNEHPKTISPSRETYDDEDPKTLSPGQETNHDENPKAISPSRGTYDEEDSKSLSSGQETWTPPPVLRRQDQIDSPSAGEEDEPEIPELEAEVKLKVTKKSNRSRIIVQKSPKMTRLRAQKLQKTVTLFLNPVLIASGGAEPEPEKPEFKSTDKNEIAQEASAEPDPAITSPDTVASGGAEPEPEKPKIEDTDKNGAAQEVAPVPDPDVDDDNRTEHDNDTTIPISATPNSFVEEVLPTGKVYDKGLVWEHALPPEPHTKHGGILKAINKVKITEDLEGTNTNEVQLRKDDVNPSTPKRLKPYNVSFNDALHHVRFYHSPEVFKRRVGKRKGDYRVHTELETEPSLPVINAEELMNRPLLFQSQEQISPSRIHGSTQQEIQSGTIDLVKAMDRETLQSQEEEAKAIISPTRIRGSTQQEIQSGAMDLVKAMNPETLNLFLLELIDYHNFK